MNNNFFIPTKIRIGYQKRNDTYTGKLAYVIYFDEKNKLRKEASWKSWIDDTITHDDHDNVPTQGFVLNKKVGGYKSDWNYRQSHIRVYDPRGFEFEISVENLLFILQESNCDKGKGLDGEFIYSWEGTELVLLPVTSVQYQNSLKFTSLKSNKISKKELVTGATYLDKDLDKCVYLGIHNVYGPDSGKKHITYYIETETYDFSNTHTHLKELVDPAPHSDYSTILDKFLNSTCGSPIDRLELRDVADTYYMTHKYYKENKTYFWAERNKDNTYSILYYEQRGLSKDQKTCTSYIISTINGTLSFNYNRNYFSLIDKPRKSKQLYAILKCGKEIMITPDSYYFYNLYSTDTYYTIHKEEPLPQSTP